MITDPWKIKLCSILLSQHVGKVEKRMNNGKGYMIQKLEEIQQYEKKSGNQIAVGIWSPIRKYSASEDA